MPPILWNVHLHTPGLHRGEHVLKHHAGLAATRVVQKIRMALDGVVRGINVVAIDGVVIAIDLVHARWSEKKKTQQQKQKKKKNHHARALRKIVGGEIHYNVARAV